MPKRPEEQGEDQKERETICGMKKVHFKKEYDNPKTDHSTSTYLNTRGDKSTREMKTTSLKIKKVDFVWHFSYLWSCLWRLSGINERKFKIDEQ